ncbi:hypothetical protein KJA15_03575 [Patescibacteria group bacterium]|nr:hypothetical protein [Patescibacteria group bacterium]
MARQPKLTKRALKRYVKLNKSTRFIAGYFKVSERTVYRRIKKYGLKDIRPKGRKPLPIVKPIPIPRGWSTSNSYINKLNKQYDFRNITFLPTRYVNTISLVCSNRKRNPRRKFTTCTVYYVAFESQLYFLYPMQIKYSREPKSFDEIYHYISNNAHELLTTKLKGQDIEVVEIVAFHFYNKPNNTIKKEISETIQTVLENADSKKLRGSKRRNL